jgi:hypothetical protein
LVGSGDEVMIGGFISRGTAASPLVVRALGPSLAAAGVSGTVSDPSLTVHDQFGTIIAANDNWRQSQAAELQALGLGCGDEREAALLFAPSPGAYTIIVRSADAQPRIGLVEVFDVR